MSIFFHSVRTALRSLTTRPLFTTAAALSLALGIGANTTIFTLVNAVFFAPLPGDAPDRVVAVYSSHSNTANDGVFNGYLSMSYPNFKDYRDENSTLEHIASLHGATFGLAGGDGSPVQVRGKFVSGSYWDVWGVRPVLGRFFGPAADVEGSAVVVVISHRLWQERYGADPEVVGKTLQVNGYELEIIGVAPANFKGMKIIAGADIWIPQGLFRQMGRAPFPQYLDHRGGRFFFVIGRMKEDLAIHQVSADLAVITRRFVDEYPDENEGLGVNVVPMRTVTINPVWRDGFVRAGWILAAMVSLLLFVACSNVANLLLVRADSRRKEIAIRLSVGAKRRQMVYQFMTESLALFALGGLLALLIAHWSLRVLWSFEWMRDYHGTSLFGKNTSLDVSLDLRIFLFTMVVAVISGLVFGLVPALLGSKPNVVGELKERRSVSQRVHQVLGLRNLLAAGQIALALAALIGANLCARSIKAAQAIDLGMEPANLVMMSFNPGLQNYSVERSKQFFDRAVDEVQAIPGVEHASLARVRPLTVSYYLNIHPGGSSAEEAERMLTNDVGADFFDTIGLEIVAGRGFTDFDRDDTQPVAVVNQTLAERFWPAQDPIGKTIFVLEEPFQVVGVAEDGKYVNINEPQHPYVYLAMEQRQVVDATLLVRGDGQVDAEVLLASISQRVQSLDPDLPLVQPQTAEQLLGAALSGPKTAAALLSIYSLLSVALAAIGIYGIMTYNVGLRLREIGIRVAMGAQRSDIFRLVLTEGLVIAGVGLALGFGLTLAGSTLIASVLYGTSPTHLPTYAFVAAMVVLIVLLACLRPAQLAMRTDPLVVLRFE